MAANTLKLARLYKRAEIFHSIQGEGVSTGCPSVFVRASLCNLHCQWCDTDYTWNWEGTPWKHENDADPDYRKFKREEYITELTVEEVAQIVSEFPCQRVILTGGEPLLQDEAWQEMMRLLVSKNAAYHFEVETNGTLSPSEGFDQLVHQYNVSPKLANSGNKKDLRCRSEALKFFTASEKAWFKFVITSQDDLIEVEQLIADHQLPADRILLMPEGRDDATLQKRRLWLADLCRDRNYRFSDRLHIQLWGSKEEFEFPIFYATMAPPQGLIRAMTPQSPHHSTSGTPSDTTPVPADAQEEFTSSDPVWKLLDEASTPEPNVFFARNVLREVRNMDPAEADAGSVGWTTRLAAIFTPPRLVIGATACACAFFAMQMIPSSNAPNGTSSVAHITPVEQTDLIEPTETGSMEVAVSDLSALVMVETLEAAAEDPTIFTRDEVVAMLGL